MRIAKEFQNKKKIAYISGLVILLVAVSGFTVHQTWLYTIIGRFDGLNEWARECIADQERCSALRPTIRNYEELVEQLIYPLRKVVRDGEDYKELQELIPLAEKNLNVADIELANTLREIEYLESLRPMMENMGQVAAEERRKFHEEYEQLSAPKILYSCGDKTYYSASGGIANYNSLYIEAKNSCVDEFKVIESDK